MEFLVQYLENTLEKMLTSDSTYKLVIKGFVQGVGFRSYVHYYALKYNIKGYVKNLPDGSVEIIANCDNCDYIKFEEYVLKGPAGSEIVDLAKENVQDANSDFEGFKIL
jgi:acylphosphatase